MTIVGWLQIVLVLALVVGLAYPLGGYIVELFEGRRTFLSPVLGPVERGLYRLAGVDPAIEQGWLVYTLCMLAFTGRLLRPALRDSAAAERAAAEPAGVRRRPARSGVQYGGQLHHQRQLASLRRRDDDEPSHADARPHRPTTSSIAAVATALVIAVIRGIARGGTKTIGNFWVDLTRATLYLYLPLSIVVALVFVAMGVPQTLQASVEATTLEGAKQAISLGPVASQEAIKLIGTNGGGFFNANSAHPFENPNLWSNMLQAWSMLVVPVALVFAFGRMVGDPRQGRALLYTMGIFFLLGLAALYYAESAGNPILTSLGVDSSLGNMEGKDLRFSQAQNSLFAAATTGTGTGAANATYDTMTPIGGAAPLFFLLIGCISPGGVGTGLYDMLLISIIAIFIAGLMVGRTPEYLGNKIETREMKLVDICDPHHALLHSRLQHDRGDGQVRPRQPRQ